MTKTVLAKYKLAALFLTVLCVFSKDARGWSEIITLRWTPLDLEREQRVPKDKRFYKMGHSLALNWATLHEDVVCLVDSLCEDVADIADWPLITRGSNAISTWSTTMTQGNTWRGLTPLQSIREEVEKLLGPPKDSVGKTFIYETENEKVHVWYSEGACKASEIGPWNMPPGTVLQIRVYPRATILLRDLQIDMSKYRRIPDPNIPNWAIYRNQEDGVMVQTQLENGCEQLEILTYGPKREDSHLRCPSRGKTASKTTNLQQNHTDRVIYDEVS